MRVILVVYFEGKNKYVSKFSNDLVSSDVEITKGLTTRPILTE